MADPTPSHPDRRVLELEVFTGKEHKKQRQEDLDPPQAIAIGVSRLNKQDF